MVKEWDRMRLTAGEYEDDIFRLIKVIDNTSAEFDVVLAIGKGGMVPAMYVCSAFCKPMIVMFANRYKEGGGLRDSGGVATSEMVGLFELKRKHTILIVDDISDGGLTLTTITDLLRYQGYDKLLTATVYLHKESTFMPNFWSRRLEGANVWIHFPYDYCGA